MGNGGGVDRGAESPPSFWARWACLAFATLWGAAAMLVVLNLHVDPDNQRTMEGQLVMHTVYVRDPGLWLANFLGIGAVIVVAAVELAVRTRRNSDRPGLCAIVMGSLLCVYSLFGWVYGVAAVAPIGAMVIVSGRAVMRAQRVVPDALRAP